MPSAELVITAFLGIALAASLVSRRTHTPYTVVLVIIGLLLAASSVSQYLGVDLLYDRFVGGGLFVGLVLPALLFETMMNLDAFEFRRVLRPALLLATVGTLIATLVVGYIMFLAAVLSLFSAFLFAALIAPTDTATVLEVFRRMSVPRSLSTMLETEAAFNDATGVVVFTVILTSFSALGQSFFPALGQFIYVLGGGVIVGLAVAYGARMLSKLASEPLPQIMLTVAAVYGSFALASALGVSGLIAVALTGLYFGNATMRGRLPGPTADEVRSFWVILAFVANTLAFLFVGLSTNVVALLGGLIPIGLAFVAVMASRFASVYPLMTLERRAGFDFPRKWINVATLAGMRGALSIVLVASLPDTVAGRDMMVTMTLGVAFVSIVVQGFLLDRYVGRAFRQAE
ncbi:MAG: sodium:proton antiporter [Nitrososphaerales archaeon]|nr:sodium:proton antiporter [Nitrososphaerales archaeon]